MIYAIIFAMIFMRKYINAMNMSGRNNLTVFASKYIYRKNRGSNFNEE